MECNENYLYATATIDGKIEEFYREGKKPELFFPKKYDNWEIKCLHSSIQDWLHIIRVKFDRVGHFYSDDFSFCMLYLPDVICELLKIEFKTKVDFGYVGKEFIIFTDKIDRDSSEKLFNKHFNGNL